MTRWRALLLLSVAELFAMSLWFGVSAVANYAAPVWGVCSVEWLTLAVQLGFVAGTLASATLNLPDIMSARRLVAVSAALGAIVNAVLATTVTSESVAIALRFATGVCLAGVYPPAMKIVATWFRDGRGVALGTLVGALTLGKASPYLINAVGGERWRVSLLLASVLAVIGGCLVLIVRDGPYALANAPFDLSQVAKVFRNRGVRLASFGYFGHMWELYAMWTWTPVMIRASLRESGENPFFAELASFVVIGSGFAGCVAAGLLADRIGRTAVTSGAMIASAACCIAIGFAFGSSPLVLLIIAAIWGATVVADSAQFSACVTELGDPRYVGTALTIQTCVGFLLTTLSIKLIPPLVDSFGWELAFVALAPGPILGTLAMLRLRSLPEAAAIAQGRR